MSEIEQERLEKLANMNADQGPGWAERFQPGSFGHHELLDRTSMTIRMLEDFLLDHPACLQNPKWYAQASQATQLLCDLYQSVGAEH